MDSSGEEPRWLAEQRAEWRTWFEAQKAEWRAWSEERDAEQRTFLRELLEHNARINQDLIRGLQELGAEIADQRAQLRANTEAVLRMIDRLGPDPA
ncbi:MAG: hypothetical protein GEU88_01570 [Solirubrobacterales bacterium]|nr:hypothetical protein [Solirubrobacterales bacterium]